MKERPVFKSFVGRNSVLSAIRLGELSHLGLWTRAAGFLDQVEVR
jgi:hypothetical protein